MIPSFLNWLENDENPSLGPPMHKQGDSKKTLGSLVADGVLKLTKELMDGSHSEQDILKAVMDYVSKKMPRQEPDSSQAPPQQGQQAEINPVAQGPAPGIL